MAMKNLNANMRKTNDSVNLHESGPAEDVWIGHCAVCLMGMGQNAIFCVLAVCCGCKRKTEDLWFHFSQTKDREIFKSYSDSMEAKVIRFQPNISLKFPHLLPPYAPKHLSLYILENKMSFCGLVVVE